MELSPASQAILAELLAERTGQEMQESRRWRFGAALTGLVRELDIADIDAAIAGMARERSGPLARRVVEALLNHETYFFRDRQLFDLLGSQAIPRLAERRANTRRLSLWSAGCSTGQEAYSLAMLFAEQGARWEGWTIDILACDVSATVVETARSGRYSQFQVQRGLSVMQTLRWFEEDGEGWQIAPTLRSMVRFKVHNVLDPLPAGSRFDLVLCRNVLLYFDAPTRARAFDRLAAATAEDGLLMLGAGETARGRTGRFAPAGNDIAGLFAPLPPASAADPGRNDALSLCR
jgi:chemotaxis protein methyltransferase CheR